MPPGTKSAPVPDFTPPKNPDEMLTHFVAISMDRAGMPLRLFTTNRWVTGECWYMAETVIGLLDRFVIDQALPSRPVNQWITNVVRLFRPQIEALLIRRDRAVAGWQQSYPKDGVSAFDDRDLEVTSICYIDIDRQLAAVQAALVEGRG
ncbi:MAG: hypothetical protein VW268_12570 [Rhodospirillaceae bacterium]